MGDSELQISSAETFLGALSASDFCIVPQILDDEPKSEEEILKERLRLREENRRRLQISFLGSVPSGKEEDLQAETKSQILKLLLQYESSINHSESQKTLLDEAKSKQDQLTADLAALQTRLTQLRAKRAQHRAKRNQALGRYYAMSLVAHHVLSQQRQLEFDTATLRWYRDSTIARAIDVMTGAIEPDPNAELGGIFRIKSQVELENEDNDDSSTPTEPEHLNFTEQQLIEMKNKQREYAKRIEDICALDDDEELQSPKPLSRVPDSTIETTSFPPLDDVDEYGSFPLTPATDLLVWNAQQLAAAAAAAPKKLKSPTVQQTSSPTNQPSSAPASPPTQPSKRKGFFGLFQ
eukprot:TRINITY_DN5676_c1_g1_i1.p1 TRINITY_DN5676_c1_g1~~TRINITY_DN5676_c1_g1_i1.p1  ORF type:complete len:351 (+),score=70.95 TRINITY_DN5676_c1_g1_i1:103-1155(+)